MHKKRIVSFLLSCSALLFALPAMGAETVEMATVTEGKINVRGKPGFIGEVITQLDRGDKVTVLERINLESPKAGEPTNWAKIKLPENTPVWAFGPFIKENKVTASRLNVRAGPGENWSVLGRIDRGTEVTPIRTVAEWMEIEAPTNAYAFIDLTLVQFDADTNAVPATPNIASAQQPEEPVATTIPDTNQPPTSVAAAEPDTNLVAVAAPPTTEAAATAPPSLPEEKVEPEPVPSQPETATNLAAATATEIPAPKETDVPPGVTPLPVPETLPQVAEPLPRRSNEPLPKRVVRREGIIRATKSIQAPTWYELAHAQTGKTINYLYDSKLGVKLKDYRGEKVVVSGQEAIDPRWPNTPILDLETLDVLP